VDWLLPPSVTLFEELLCTVGAEDELHILLSSPGGDGETAIRMLRAVHSRCRRLVVVVPDQAKSAATLIALGADEILMGPASDLGPIDPQIELPSRPGFLIPAKDII
jgi:ClpP class serine protease